MAKKSTNIPKLGMSRSEIKKYIALREKRKILFQKDLMGKRLIFNEDVFLEDGSVDFKLYYINKEDDIKNEKTIIYIDTYSNRKKREASNKEYWHRRKAAM